MLILTLLNEILKPIQAVCYKGIKCCIMMQCFQINEANKSFKCCHLIVSSITLLHPYMHLIWDVARVYFGVFVVYEMASVQTVIYNIQHKMLTESTATILLIGMQYLIKCTRICFTVTVFASPSNALETVKESPKIHGKLRVIYPISVN